jgi:predicted phage terminase large subunit-like protein
MARNPTHLVLSGSHTQEFARRKIGRVVRNLVERHGDVLGIAMSPDSSAMDDWALLSGGGYRAVGVGNAIAGERADLGIVEDPFARWEDGQSATAQDGVWEWYTGDFIPRLKPQAKRVIIMTRFNEFDLLGRIRERDARLGIKWRRVELPMLAKLNDPIGRAPGERLWPEWFTEQQVIEARSDAQKWAALYQQEPSPETGDYFKADWLRAYDKTPARDTLRVYGGSDYAVTSEGGDYTVHIVVGLDPAGRMYLLDLWRGQKQGDVWIEAFCDMVLQWKPLGWAEETGQIRSAIGPFLERRMRERKAYVAREQFPTRGGDKAIRAQSIRGRMALEGLYVPTGADWYPDFRAELMSFPAGKHDDQVDALGLIGQLLDRMMKGTAPAPQEPMRGASEMTFGEVLRLATPAPRSGRI